MRRDEKEQEAEAEAPTTRSQVRRALDLHGQLLSACRTLATPVGAPVFTSVYERVQFYS